MSEFTGYINTLNSKYEQKLALLEKVDSLVSELNRENTQYAIMLEAQALLSTVSDNNTTAVLDYITGIINKALVELFPYDTRRIYLEKSLHGGQHAHIKIKLVNSLGKERDLVLQSGTGLRQVISFLFVVSLIEIRKGRRILVMDELLSGLHPEAKNIIMDILQIFAEEGFQFVMVEYGVDTIGRLYLVEKPTNTATVTPFDGRYNNEIFVFNRPVEIIDKSIFVDESVEVADAQEQGCL